MGVGTPNCTVPAHSKNMIGSLLALLVVSLMLGGFFCILFSSLFLGYCSASGRAGARSWDHLGGAGSFRDTQTCKYHVPHARSSLRLENNCEEGVPLIQKG